MKRTFNLSGNDINVSKLGYNLGIVVDEDTIITFTSEAVHKLLNDDTFREFIEPYVIFRRDIDGIETDINWSEFIDKPNKK